MCPNTIYMMDIFHYPFELVAGRQISVSFSCITEMEGASNAHIDSEPNEITPHMLPSDCVYAN